MKAEGAVNFIELASVHTIREPESEPSQSLCLHQLGVIRRELMD